MVGGSSNKMEIALVFKVTDLEYMDRVINILLDKNIVGTFFVDGEVIEKNVNKMLELTSNGNELENLGYDSKYDNDKLIYTNNMIEAITRVEPRYCYSDYKNNDVLKLCSNNNMYTIKPTVSVSSYPFVTVRNNTTNVIWYFRSSFKYLERKLFNS